MTELHTYRLAFNNGDVFKTNAESERKALHNFRTTFTDSQILEKGGTAFPFPFRKKIPETVNFLTAREVSAITGISPDLLSGWVRKGAVRPCIEKNVYSWETVGDVRNCLRLRRKNPKNFLEEARRCING